jgi:hypothetical protein
MKLSIVASKGIKNEVGRMCTDSPLTEVLEYLGLFGVGEWVMDTEGSIQLCSNQPDLYVAVGPTNRHDDTTFLEEAKGLIEPQVKC